MRASLVQQKQKGSEPQEDEEELDPIQQLLMADAEEEARGFDQSPSSEQDGEMNSFSEEKVKPTNKITKQTSGTKTRAKAAKKAPKTTRSPPKKGGASRKNVMFGSKKDRDELIL